MRTGWYVVTRALQSGINAANGAIEGIRHADNIAPPGTILPGKFFDFVGDDLFEPYIVNGLKAIEEYLPSDEELPILWTLYPATRPAAVDVPVNGMGAMVGKWFKVQEVRVNGLRYGGWGLSALVDVPFVCRAGDVPEFGAVIPAQWFSGLSQAQFDRLMRWGAVSAEWMKAQPSKWQTSQRPKQFLMPYAPSQAEKVKLLKLFEGADKPYLKPSVKKAAKPSTMDHNENTIVGEDE